MDNYLFSEIQKRLPKMNPIICNGYASEKLKEAMTYIDDVFQCAAKSFPAGLEYLGLRKCTPDEELRIVTAKQYGKHSYEMSRSDVYLVRADFAFNGDPIDSQYLYLPFAGKAGSVHILGTKFYISPVLADICISVDNNGLFIPPARAKLNFERLNYTFLCNNIPKSVSVVHSKIYNQSADTAKRKQQTRTTSVKSTLVHYLFCRFGMTETFKRFTQCEVHVGTDDINTDTYHPNAWVICQSGASLNKRARKGGEQQQTNIKVAVPIDQFNNELVMALLAGFYYIVDHYPDRMVPEYIDQIRQWRIILGHVIHNTTMNEGRLADDMDNHLDFLDDYVDSLTIKMLRKGGLQANDIWELFVYILENMRDIINKTDTASMYGKELMVLRYVLFDITRTIFNCMFKLKPNKNRKELTKEDIINNMNKSFGKYCIAVFNINTGHGEVETASGVAGDNMLLKITSKIVLQTNTTGLRRREVIATDPAKQIHVSLAEICSYQNQTKPEPTSREVINAFVLVDENGFVQRHPEYMEFLNSVQEKFHK